MNTTEKVLKVEGMTCGACVRHVQNALRGVDGMTNVEVSLEEGKARVAYDPSRATVDAMIHALGEAGYSSGASE